MLLKHRAVHLNICYKVVLIGYINKLDFIVFQIFNLSFTGDHAFVSYLRLLHPIQYHQWRTWTEARTVTFRI